MRFIVIGTDPQTGRDVEETLEAKTADHAEFLASQRGISVVRVKIAPMASALEPRPVRADTPRQAMPRSEPLPVPQVAPLPAPIPQPELNIKQAPGTTSIAPDSPRKLGMVALGLGGVGLLFCWIPMIGILCIPLCLIGAGAGGMGAWTIKRRTRGSSPPFSAMALPLGGAVLSTFALAIAGIVALSPSDSANAAIQAAPSELSSVPAAAAKAARSLTIVGSHTSGEAKSIFTSKFSAATTVTPAQPPSPVKLGAAEIELVSARVENLILVGEQGRQQGESTTKMLVLKVRVSNTGDTPMEYTTFCGSAENLDGRAATLADERGVRYRRTTFELGIGPVGHVQQDVLRPGRSLTDLLVFHVPPASMVNATLTLQGHCVGTVGTAELTFPASLIQR